MTPTELYLYAHCSSCQNAEKLLEKHGIAATKRDLFKDRLTAGELGALFERIGKPACEMLSTRSRPYQQFGLAQRTLTDQEIVRLMAEYPALVRRPIVVAGEQGHVGFNRAAIERLVATARNGRDGDA